MFDEVILRRFLTDTQCVIRNVVIEHNTVLKDKCEPKKKKKKKPR